MLGYVLGFTLVLSVFVPIYFTDAFADSFVVHFEEQLFDVGDSLTISGEILDVSMPVIAMSIYDPDGKIMSANNLEISPQQTFSKTIVLDSSIYEKVGDYDVKLEYGQISKNYSFVIGDKLVESEIIDEFADKPSILQIDTDKRHYSDNEIIEVHGIVSELDSPSVLIGIYDPFGMPVGFYFGMIETDLTFSTSFLVKDGVNFRVDGTYSVKAHYAEYEIISFFDYSKVSNIVVKDDVVKDDVVKDDVVKDDVVKDDVVKDDVVKDDVVKDDVVKDDVVKDDVVKDDVVKDDVVKDDVVKDDVVKDDVVKDDVVKDDVVKDDVVKDDVVKDDVVKDDVVKDDVVKDDVVKDDVVKDDVVKDDVVKDDVVKDDVVKDDVVKDDVVKDDVVKDDVVKDDVVKDDVVKDDVVKDDVVKDDVVKDDVVKDDVVKDDVVKDDVVKDDVVKDDVVKDDVVKDDVVKDDVVKDDVVKPTNNENPKLDNLSIEDLEFGKSLNQINLKCDSGLFTDIVSYSDGMGPALYRLCEFDSALNFFDEILVDNPDDIKTLVNKGSTLGKLGYFYEALVYYDYAIAIDPNFLPAKNNKANVLATLRDLDSAILLYDEILMQEPDNKTVQTNFVIAQSLMDEIYSKPSSSIATDTSKLVSDEIMIDNFEKQKPSNFLDEVSVVFSTLGSLFNFLN